VAVFDHLKQVCEVHHIPWHIHLFRDPEIVDVRAVRGNQIFVWSGFLDVAKNEDEIDLDTLDREYSETNEREAAEISLFSIPLKRIGS